MNHLASMNQNELSVLLSSFLHLVLKCYINFFCFNKFFKYTSDTKIYHLRHQKLVNK